MAEKVVVLGIDPGSIITGFGVVETDGSSSRVIAWGSVKTSSRTPLPQHTWTAPTRRLLQAVAGTIRSRGRLCHTGPLAHWSY